jgi:hypothetical protein
MPRVKETKDVERPAPRDKETAQSTCDREQSAAARTDQPSLHTSPLGDGVCCTLCSPAEQC